MTMALWEYTFQVRPPTGDRLKGRELGLRGLHAEIGEKGSSPGGETRFQPRRAIAVAARPGLLSAQVTATAARVRILNFLEVEVLLPVLALLEQRRRAEAHLDPLHPPIVERARAVHVAQVLVTGNRAGPEGGPSIAVSRSVDLPGLTRAVTR